MSIVCSFALAAFLFLSAGNWRPECGPAANAGEIIDDVADIVLGQKGMSYPFSNRTDACGLVLPTSVAVDTSREPYILYVVDSGNRRVLAYRTPLAAQRPVKADLVIGQPDFESAFFNEDEAAPDRFLSPVCVAVDSHGNVYVSDAGYNRILRFDRPFETDVRPDRVFGQQNRFDAMEPNEGGVSADSLFAPTAIHVDPHTGDLWVADSGNNRVLCFHQPLSGDTTADFVLGQPDFTFAQPNAGGVGARSLRAPMGVTTRGSDVLVADSGNRRILIYANALAGDGTATHVLGQDGSFTRNEAGCSPFRFELPTSLTITDAKPDGSRLLVADSANHRVLFFALEPTITSQPIGLWGQGTNLHACTPNAGGLGPASLAYPAAVAISPDDVLWVADQGNNRILGFQSGVTRDREADYVIGQIDLRHGTENLVDAWGLSSPRDVAVDRSVQPNRLYICDSYNNRILGYASTETLSSRTECTIVIGQPDSWSNDPGGGRASLSAPTSLAVDSNGNLFVADRDNSRVLWFERPFETDTVADRVFGQPDFASHRPNRNGVSARSLNRPESVAVDRPGNLYISDTRNHRILRFDRPIRSDATADAVWGQNGDFTSNKEYGGVGVRANTLSYPFGLNVRADGLLAVADTNNHRVLIFDTQADDPLTAVQVFGQAGRFDIDRDNLGGCTASSLSGPEGVVFWREGLFIADTANCRVLWYERPTSENHSACAVYGQFGSFKDNQRGMGRTGARNLWFPSGMDLDSLGNLYVADREQNRVLVFKASKPWPDSHGANGGSPTATAPGGGLE